MIYASPHQNVSRRCLNVHARMCARVRHLEHELEDEIRAELGDNELSEEV